MPTLTTRSCAFFDVNDEVKAALRQPTAIQAETFGNLIHTTAELLSDTDDCVDAHAEIADIHVTLK